MRLLTLQQRCHLLAQPGALHNSPAPACWCWQERCWAIHEEVTFRQGSGNRSPDTPSLTSALLSFCPAACWVVHPQCPPAVARAPSPALLQHHLLAAAPLRGQGGRSSLHLRSCRPQSRPNTPPFSSHLKSSTHLEILSCFLSAHGLQVLLEKHFGAPVLPVHRRAHLTEVTNASRQHNENGIFSSRSVPRPYVG